MTTLVEADLEITLPVSVQGRRLDDPTSHGLSHCMKAVDFVVELPDRIYFIELKDPDNPAASAESRTQFLQKLTGGALDRDLTQKFRDSFLYEFACDRVDRPVYCLVLLAVSSLTPAELLARTDSLKRQLPLKGPAGVPWPRPWLAGCAVVNLHSWNQVLPWMPVRRLSR